METQHIKEEERKQDEEYHNKLSQLADLCSQLDPEIQLLTDQIIKDLKRYFDTVRADAQMWKLRATEDEKLKIERQDGKNKVASNNETVKQKITDDEKLQKKKFSPESDKIEDLEMRLQQALAQMEQLQGDNSKKLKEEEHHCMNIINSAEKQRRLIEAWTEKASQYEQSIKAIQELTYPLELEANTDHGDESQFDDHEDDDDDEKLEQDSRKNHNTSSFLQNISTNSGILKGYSKSLSQSRSGFHSELSKSKTFDSSTTKLKNMHVSEQLTICQTNLKKTERKYLILKNQCASQQKQLEQKEFEFHSSLKMLREKNHEETNKIHELSKEITSLNDLVITMRNKISFLEAENAVLSTNLNAPVISNTKMATTTATTNESANLSRNDQFSQCLMKKKILDSEQTLKDKDKTILSLQNENKLLKQENKNCLKEIETLKEKVRQLTNEIPILMRSKGIFQNAQKIKQGY